MDMDATRARCTFIAVNGDKRCEPCMVHFAANEAPAAYTRQLFSLFKKFSVPSRGLLSLCASDMYQNEIKFPIYSGFVRAKKLLGR